MLGVLGIRPYVRPYVSTIRVCLGVRLRSILPLSRDDFWAAMVFDGF